jgi:hypothetical protein
MGVVRITEAELARDLHSVLAKVQEGLEVIVEQDHRPVPIIKPSTSAGRSIFRCGRGIECPRLHGDSR